MRTRLVRVRRRPWAVIWAVILLVLTAAVYIRVSLPALREIEAEAAGAVSRGERVTREIIIEALEMHLISFGGYDGAASARVEAARYVPRGAAGYVLPLEKWEVIGAGYSRREEAEKVCAQLETAEGIACRVISIASPEAVLRMTAGSAQIAAFLEGEKTLRSVTDALGQLAFSVDRGEANVKQAGMVIESQRERAAKAAEELALQTEGSSNGVFLRLQTLLEELCAQTEQMLRESSGMALSSRLKYVYVDFKVREIEMLNDMVG